MKSKDVGITWFLFWLKFSGVHSIEENRIGSPDIGLLSVAKDSTLPVGFERGWAVRPKRAVRGEGQVSRDMMVELEKIFVLGETGRSKVSPAQAVERLESMKNLTEV